MGRQTSGTGGGVWKRPSWARLGEDAGGTRGARWATWAPECSDGQSGARETRPRHGRVEAGDLNELGEGG